MENTPKKEPINAVSRGDILEEKRKGRNACQVFLKTLASNGVPDILARWPTHIMKEYAGREPTGTLWT